MAEIISMSLGKDLLEQVNKMENEFEFSGRSETIRAALNLLVDEYKNKAELTGFSDAVIFVTHRDKPEEISKIRHEFNSLIRTQIHNHLSNGKCLEMFVINGQSQEIKKMLKKFQKNKKIEYAKLLIP